MGALKSGFDSCQGFPYESSSHMVYKILYVNSFCSFYYYDHCDYCLVNIVILYSMYTWGLYIIKRLYSLFVCLFVCVSGSDRKKKSLQFKFVCIVSVVTLPF